MTERLSTLALAGGRQLRVRLNLPASEGRHPAVVVCHGFKGFAAWGFFPPLAELLASRGFAVVRFDFTGSGMEPGDELVTHPEAFRTDTYLHELAELLALLEGLGDLAPGAIDHHRIALLGHSRGGAIALLAAADDRWHRRIRALVTWSAIARCDRWSDAEKAIWRRDGELPVVNSRTGQHLALGLGLLEELESRSAALDLLAAAGRRTAPWLLLHGTLDESVPFAEGEALAAAAAPPAELRPISGGGHTFGARHPFTGPTPHLVQAFNATQRFLHRELRH